MKMSKRNRVRRRQRQEEAQVRREVREKRTDADQLARLEANGHGHCREATRLRDRIQRENASRKKKKGKA